MEKKKKFVAPLMKVYHVKTSDIMVTSGNALTQQNEEYYEEETTIWY